MNMTDNAGSDGRYVGASIRLVKIHISSTHLALYLAFYGTCKRRRVQIYDIATNRRRRDPRYRRLSQRRARNGRAVYARGPGVYPDACSGVDVLDYGLGNSFRAMAGVFTMGRSKISPRNSTGYSVRIWSRRSVSTKPSILLLSLVVLPEVSRVSIIAE